MILLSREFKIKKEASCIFDFTNKAIYLYIIYIYKKIVFYVLFFLINYA